MKTRGEFSWKTLYRSTKLFRLVALADVISRVSCCFKYRKPSLQVPLVHYTGRVFPLIDPWKGVV